MTGRITRWVVGSGLALALAAFALGQTSDPVTTRSERYDGKRFRQPEPLTIRFKDWAKRQWNGHKGPWRKFTYTPPGPAPAEYTCDGDLRVTFVNHATMLIQMDGVNILTDPTWARKSVPVVGRTRRRPPGLRFDELPKIDAVLISHNHQDHMDLPTLRKLTQEFEPPIYTGLGNAPFLAKKGIPGGHDLDWWQSTEIAPGVTVTAVPARHHSGRSLFDKDRTLWCGFVLQGPSGSVYFAGDTGYGSHFEEIGRRFPNLRLAILPIGGFKPIWYMHEQHLGPEAALQALKDLGAASMIPMHFGTFPNGDEGETEAVEVLEAAIAQSPDLTKRVSILDNGQSVDVAPAPPRDLLVDSTMEASILSSGAR